MRDSALKDLGTPIPHSFVPGAKAFSDGAYDFGSKPGSPSVFVVALLDLSRVDACFLFFVS
jgi:hypothetical protein